MPIAYACTYHYCNMLQVKLNLFTPFLLVNLILHFGIQVSLHFVLSS